MSSEYMKNAGSKAPISSTMSTQQEHGAYEEDAAPRRGRRCATELRFCRADRRPATPRGSSGSEPRRCANCRRSRRAAAESRRLRSCGGASQELSDGAGLRADIRVDEQNVVRGRPRQSLVCCGAMSRLTSNAMTDTSGNRSRTTAALPSEEALSTTIVSETLPLAMSNRVRGHRVS